MNGQNTNLVLMAILSTKLPNSIIYLCTHRILGFLHAHSHEDNIGAPEHDANILSETKQIMTDILELINALDKDHFDGMKRCIKEAN
jgi:hypothetical protein